MQRKCNGLKINCKEMGSKSKGRIPRHKKKSWKKQVDIADVEEHLEDVRLQERFGGLVSEKASDEIFTIDKAPELVDGDVLLRQRRPRRPKVDQDNLRCFQNLKGLPGAKVPVKTHFLKDKRPAFIKAKTNQKKAENELFAALSNDISLKKKEEKKKQIPKDPWADEDTADSAADWLEPALRRRRRCRTEGAVRRPLYMRVKTSLLPAVEPPHAGQSYHPEAGDHTALLEQALQVEHRKEADFQRWERQTTAKFPSSRPTEADWLKEMSGGLVDDGQEKADEEKSVAPPLRKVPKPKTRQQRRKKRERAVAERERLAAVTTRRSENEVFRLRTIARELRQREARTAERQAARLERRCARATQPLTLGRERFEPAPIELNLTDELPGTLRNVRVEGDPLQERYKSLQRRNIIEPRVRTTQKKKYKRKRFDRITASDREPNKLKTERNL